MAKDFIVLDEVYEPWQTKAIIGSMDMLVSGRVHASVAALSQSVPTVLMDYGHAPEAHKIRGFASVSGADEFVTDPFEDGTLREAIRNCWESSLAYRARLSAHMPSVRKEAMLHFQALKKFES
jgi:colanic acid/amylovoran biosynthesis protein